MRSGQIITLEDNEKYLLLLETTQEDHKFFYANKLTIDEKTTSEYEIFEEITYEDGTYMDIVDDQEVKEFLMKVFTVDMMEIASDFEKNYNNKEDI